MAQRPVPCTLTVHCSLLTVYETLRKAQSFTLTFPLKLIDLELRLGDRPVAGRRVLAPLTEVRILVPQPQHPEPDIYF